MKQFETLYKRGKNGEVLYWKVQVWTSDHPTIEKESGQIGTTNPTKHSEPIYKGKNIGKANETTPYDQACFDAESDWRKKRDSGYKSLEDLGIPKENIDWEAVSGYRSLSSELNIALPQFNTDANGQIKPMLATDWKKIKKIDYPVLVQPKLDGVRCLMIVNRAGPDLTVTFLSRSGKEYTTLNHIRESVLENAGPEPFTLDGEVYSDELSFQGILRAVKKQRPESEKLHFRAYDVVTTSTQDRRLEEVEKLVEQLNSPFIHLVEWIVGTSEAAVKHAHDLFVQNGYEGAMIRLYNGKYEQGCRSRSLLKVKEFDEAEFRFVRWDQGQREEDLLAVLWANDNDGQFRAKMIGTREERAELREQTPKLITVKYFGLTEEKYPRFPVGKSPRSGE